MESNNIPEPKIHSMEPTLELIRIVSWTVPKIDGPFSERIFKYVLSPTIFTDSIIEGVIAFYDVRFNIKLSITIDDGYNIANIKVRRDPVIPVTMPPCDRFYHEVVGCIDDKIEEAQYKELKTFEISICIDRAFFDSYLPDDDLIKNLRWYYEIINEWGLVVIKINTYADTSIANTHITFTRKYKEH
jgi:hypothetical protein